MIALEIIGIFVLSVILLVVFVLFSPVHIFFAVDLEKDIKLKLRFWFLKFDLLEKKDDGRQSKEKKKKESFATKTVKKLFGISKIEGQKTTDKKTANKSIADTVSQKADVIKTWLEGGKKLVKKIKINRLRILSVSAGADVADVAVEYGTMCAALYPFLGFLQANAVINNDNVDVKVECDFERDKPCFEAETEVSIKVIDALSAAIYIVKNNV